MCVCMCVLVVCGLVTYWSVLCGWVPLNCIVLFISPQVYNSLTWTRQGDVVGLVVGALDGSPCGYSVAVYNHKSKLVLSQTRCTTSSLLCGILAPDIANDDCAHTNRFVLGTPTQSPKPSTARLWLVYSMTKGLDTVQYS